MNTENITLTIVLYGTLKITIPSLNCKITIPLTNKVLSYQRLCIVNSHCAPRVGATFVWQEAQAHTPLQFLISAPETIVTPADIGRHTLGLHNHTMSRDGFSISQYLETCLRGSTSLKLWKCWHQSEIHTNWNVATSSEVNVTINKTKWLIILDGKRVKETKTYFIQKNREVDRWIPVLWNWVVFD